MPSGVDQAWLSGNHSLTSVIAAITIVVDWVSWSTFRPTRVVAVAVPALDAALLVLHDELGLLSTGFLPARSTASCFRSMTLEARLVPSFWTAERPPGRGSTGALT
jgi:hypothetical protein